MIQNSSITTCPECSTNLVKHETNSAYFCKNCNFHFPLYLVNGYEIIDFVSNDLELTKGFSSADDMSKFQSLLSIFDRTDFYGLVKVYETLCNDHDKNIFNIKIPKPQALSEYDLNHGKDSLKKVEAILNNSSKKINYDGAALENGSGHGFFTYEFAKRFNQLYVTDCSICYLLLASKKNSEI